MKKNGVTLAPFFPILFPVDFFIVVKKSYNMATACLINNNSMSWVFQDTKQTWHVNFLYNNIYEKTTPNSFS